MVWSWQLKDWPNFKYDSQELDKLEQQFMHNSGLLFGAYQHIASKDRDSLLIEIISDEAINTSEIEGSYLNRSSIQLSLRKNFGLISKAIKPPSFSPVEQGMADIMVNVYKKYHNKLTHKDLCKWHKLVTVGRTDLEDIGKYRTHTDDIQIVSGFAHRPTVHFIAPPSDIVNEEMERFIKWFNQSENLKPLTRAGLAHIYFLCIHPFEDGNGRVARAISEKSLYQSYGEPLLISISTIIRNNKKAYYNMLNNSNQTLDITKWLVYFADVIIKAQDHSYNMIKFIIKKAKFYDIYKDQLNKRQQKVIDKLFEVGPEGFKGGLSADNYIAITKTSRATATRDLNDLVQKAILVKTGELKSTRYYLKTN